MAGPIEIRVLTPQDQRAGLESGHPELDRFFHRYAGQNQFRHHLGVTYVAVRDGAILGFVTVAPSELQVDDLPEESRRRLPRYPLPVLRLARLAVDRRFRGQGIGKALLRFGLRLACRMRDDLGCVGVVVDAKPEAEAFYRALGFEPIAALEGAMAERPEPALLFLPISAVPDAP